ncbi:hypothetical protein A0H81_10213 [Grifola frondosa]|uniref:MYND-type domain-containing protein n=1 Tax=Grifola frondosa TaxID=5627 RepID=A0A1C7M0D2_GRIFR|nr:hypothetical protein A0H81_10213 [Grifola frondosa]
MESDWIGAHVDLLSLFCCIGSHPLRTALLRANAVQVVTTALVKLSVLVNVSGELVHFFAMRACFCYLSSCLDIPDDITLVLESVGAGLLQAFCDCSTQFSKLASEDLKNVLDIVQDIVSRYLIYRSVIEAVDNAVSKIERGPQKGRVDASLAKTVWDTFCELAHERSASLVVAGVPQNGLCDNKMCQKKGYIDEFRQCTVCLNALYCSKACQKIAWKKGNHKQMCSQWKFVKPDRSQISSLDRKFIKRLAIHDARSHLAHLRQLAQRDFLIVSCSDLVVCIDYCVVPTVFTLKQLRGYEYQYDRALPTYKAQNTELVERAQDDPASFTLIETTVTHGRVSLILSDNLFRNIDSEYGGCINLDAMRIIFGL